MAGSGTTALATDVNNPYNTGIYLMGTGSVTRGYGQTTFGSGVSVGTVISANDFNNIRYDLLNASAHQNGTAAALNLAGNVAGQTINSTDPSNFATYASTVDANRYNAHSSRISTIAWGSNNRTSSWASAVSAVYTLTFTNSNVARYFWNAGGKIRITASRSGGASTAQNTAWTNLLSSAGTQEFGASSIYSLAQYSSYTTLYTATSSAPYASNRYTISGACVGTTGSTGNANQFNFLLSFSDPYVDPSPGNPPAPDDLVDGTLSYSVELKYPTGGAALSPSGSWVGFNSNGAGGFYVLPSYSAPAITGG